MGRIGAFFVQFSATKKARRHSGRGLTATAGNKKPAGRPLPLGLVYLPDPSRFLAEFDLADRF
jgi:hypothetical protein